MKLHPPSSPQYGYIHQCRPYHLTKRAKKKIKALMQSNQLVERVNGRETHTVSRNVCAVDCKIATDGVDEGVGARES